MNFVNLPHSMPDEKLIRKITRAQDSVLGGCVRLFVYRNGLNYRNGLLYVAFSASNAFLYALNGMEGWKPQRVENTNIMHFMYRKS